MTADRPHANELLRNMLAKAGITGSINPTAQQICSIIDVYNAQHWHDRNRYDERIKKLESEITSLKSRLHTIETKGES